MKAKLIEVIYLERHKGFYAMKSTIIKGIKQYFMVALPVTSGWLCKSK